MRLNICTIPTTGRPLQGRTGRRNSLFPTKLCDWFDVHVRFYSFLHSFLRPNCECRRSRKTSRNLIPTPRTTNYFISLLIIIIFRKISISIFCLVIFLRTPWALELHKRRIQYTWWFRPVSQPFIFSNERNHSLTHYSNVHTSGFIGNRTNFLRHNFLLLSSP